VRRIQPALLTVPWVFAIAGWIIGAAAMHVKADSIYEDPTVVGVLAGVWLAVAFGFVLITVIPDAGERPAPAIAVCALSAKFVTVILFLVSSYFALFFSTFRGGTLKTASGKYLLPGPFISLTGFCVGWFLVECLAAARAYGAIDQNRR
jgi:hypothetical protein